MLTINDFNHFFEESKKILTGLDNLNYNRRAQSTDNTENMSWQTTSSQSDRKSPIDNYQLAEQQEKARREWGQDDDYDDLSEEEKFFTPDPREWPFS